MAINPLQQQQPLLDKLGAPVVAQDPQEQDINDLNIGGPVNFQQKIAAQQAAAAQQSAPSRPRPGEVAAGVDPNAPVTPLPSGGIPVSAPAQPPSNQGGVPNFGVGLQAQTTTQTGGLDVEKSQNLLNKAQQTQAKAIEANVNAQIAQNQFTAESDKALAQQKAADIAEVQAKNLDFEQRRQEQLDKVNQAADTLTNSKVKNPWANASIGAKIEAGIAVGLGALGAAYTGGGNQAYNIIKDGIDRDVQLQQKNAEINERAYGAARDTFGIIKGIIGDEQQATLLMQKQRYDQIATDLQAKIDTTKDQAAKAQGMQLLGQIQATAADKQAQIDQLASARTVTSEQKGVMPVDASGKAIYLPPAEIQARTITYPNGQKALAPSPEAATKIREHVATTTSLNDTLNRLISLRQKYGVQVMPTAEKAQIESLGGELKAKMKEALGFGALTETDEKLIEGMTGGDPTKVGQVIARLQELKHGVNNDSSRFLTAQGVQPLGQGSGAHNVGAGDNAQGFQLNTPQARGQQVASH